MTTITASPPDLRDHAARPSQPAQRPGTDGPAAPVPPAEDRRGPEHEEHEYEYEEPEHDTTEAPADAFAAAATAAYPRLLAAARWHGLGPEEAEDVVQNTLEAALLAAGASGKFPDGHVPIAYMIGILNHKAADHRDSNQRRELAQARAFHRDIPGRTAQSDAATRAIQSEQSAAVLRVVSWLPPRQRDVIALDIDGYTTTEIAKILNTGEATVRSLRRHARTKLARFIYR